MTTATILEYDNATDEICANPDTPAIVLERVPKIDTHDARAEAAGIAISRETESIRQERGDIDRQSAAIARADAAAGQLMRDRPNENGTVDRVAVDRLTPLNAKDAALRKRLNEINTAHVPAKIGGPNVKWLGSQRHRTLTAADPVTCEIKKGESVVDAYERFKAKTDSKLEKIEAIWRMLRPVPEVLEEIPKLVDQLAHKPRLGELFAGSHTSSHRGRRQIEYPNRKILFELERVRQDSSFGESFGTVTSAAALVAWLFRDELIEKLSDLARARGDRKSMSAEAKRNALDAAYAELETALRIEVATGFAVEESTGGLVDFRPCHPCIFLGLAADPSDIAEWDSRA